MCFQFSGRGIHNNTSCIYFSIQYYKSQPIKARKSSLYKKSNNNLIQKALCPKVSYCKSFTEHYSGSTIKHIAHLHRHTGSDLDIWQHSSSYFKSNSLIALRIFPITGLNKTIRPTYQYVLGWVSLACLATAKLYCKGHNGNCVVMMCTRLVNSYWLYIWPNEEH